MIKAVMMWMIKTLIETEEGSVEALAAIKKAGYDGIELFGSYVRKMSPAEKKLIGRDAMPCRNCGDHDWKKIINGSGLKVIGIHQNLDRILEKPDDIIEEAHAFKSRYVVMSGIGSLDYSKKANILGLAKKLNASGKLFKKNGLDFAYHNHSSEFRRMENGKPAFGLLVEKTDPEYVNFEFDSYWPTLAGVNAEAAMEKLGTRLKLYHINDRGPRVEGETGPYVNADSMELGYGFMNLENMAALAKKAGVDAVILEGHGNFINDSPLDSIKMSAAFMKKHFK